MMVTLIGPATHPQPHRAVRTRARAAASAAATWRPGAPEPTAANVEAFVLDNGARMRVQHGLLGRAELLHDAWG